MSPCCARVSSSISCFARTISGPSANFSLSQHEGDLEWQQSEFLAKRSFAYGLWSGSGARVLGGVYLYPSVLPEVAVELFFWKVAGAPITDEELETQLRVWLARV